MRRQDQRQGQPLRLVTDPHDRRALGRRGRTAHAHLLRMAHKELAGRGRLHFGRTARQRQPVHLQHPLLGQPQPLPRGHQQLEPRRLRQQPREHPDPGQQMLHVVQHQQQALAPQPARQRRQRVGRIGKVHAQDPPARDSQPLAQHGRGVLPRRHAAADAGQVDQVDPVGEGVLVPQHHRLYIVRRHLRRQARLAAAAQPQQRDQPARRLPQPRPQRRHLALPPQEFAR